MDEMYFICDGEEITINTMCTVFNKTKKEILNLGYKIGNKESFVIDDFKYEVIIPHGNSKVVRDNPSIPNRRPSKKQYKPVAIKKSGGNNQKIYITNVIKNTGGTLHKRKHYLDGNLSNKDEIASLLGVSIFTVNSMLARVKSLTVNGHKISIRDEALKYTAIKDGVAHKNMCIQECITLTGLPHQTVKRLYESGHYSRKDGWRITR